MRKCTMTQVSDLINGSPMTAAGEESTAHVRQDAPPPSHLTLAPSHAIDSHTHNLVITLSRPARETAVLLPSTNPIGHLQLFTCCPAVARRRACPFRTRWLPHTIELSPRFAVVLDVIAKCPGELPEHCVHLAHGCPFIAGRINDVRFLLNFLLVWLMVYCSRAMALFGRRRACPPCTLSLRATPCSPLSI
ncbi:ATP-binding cassette sub-family G member 8 [Lates japonicus]|uniref:ATP-binding cassette sub-family G member 8 n=1 Tax=Lates japonicus TaxID=270547 RepID=A0AAD3RD14_LATJO|nr:ATP-binding cassette sub-family G member 8 [Lates japonicus]